MKRLNRTQPSCIFLSPLLIGICCLSLSLPGCSLANPSSIFGQGLITETASSKPPTATKTKVIFPSPSATFTVTDTPTDIPTPTITPRMYDISLNISYIPPNGGWVFGPWEYCQHCLFWPDLSKTVAAIVMESHKYNGTLDSYIANFKFSSLPKMPNYQWISEDKISTDEGNLGDKIVFSSNSSQKLHFAIYYFQNGIGILQITFERVDNNDNNDWMDPIVDDSIRTIELIYTTDFYNGK